LCHIRDILKKSGGTIKLNPDFKNGTEFIVKLKGRA